MKEKFLALVNEVKATGIVAILSNTSNVDEFKETWQKFTDENPELFKKALEWGAEFKKNEPGNLFEDGEAIENPLEVVVAIRIAGNKVSECDVFATYGDLVNALEDLKTSFSDIVAECVDYDYIYDIKAEDIFPEDDDGDGEAEPENGEEELCLGDHFDEDFDSIPGRE